VNQKKTPKYGVATRIAINNNNGLKQRKGKNKHEKRLVRESKLRGGTGLKRGGRESNL